MAGIAWASSPATNFFGNLSSDNETPAYCFMPKASKEKVSSKHHKVHSSDQYSSDEDDHAKLIKIANIQQNSLEKIEKTLRKSEGLLVEEMEKNQSLTEEYFHSQVTNGWTLNSSWFSLSRPRKIDLWLPVKETGTWGVERGSWRFDEKILFSPNNSKRNLKCLYHLA